MYLGGIYFDSTLLLMIPAILLTLFAQAKVKSAFSQYLKVSSKKGYTGYDVARGILDQNGLYNVSIERSRGQLSDHYDPSKKVVRLSNDVYDKDSIASVSVAAHEVGHAIQHAKGYQPLNLRSALFPAAKIGSSISWFFIVFGILIPQNPPVMLNIGIGLFSAAVIFQIATLPVEFNASSRAVKLLADGGYLENSEIKHSKKVLNAAALTYVAAAATAVLQLLRLILIRNRRSS